MEGENIQINTKATNPIFSDEDFEEQEPNLLSYISFSIKDLLYWWYIQMPIFYLRKWKRVSIVISDQLSLSLLIKNFFVPWKRHKAAVGYFIGILTKSFYLPIAIIIYITVLSIYTLFIFSWLLTPIIAVFFTLISLFLK